MIHVGTPKMPSAIASSVRARRSSLMAGVSIAAKMRDASCPWLETTRVITSMLLMSALWTQYAR